MSAPGAGAAAAAPHAARPGPACMTLLALPDDMLCEVFARLPVDVRLLCLRVCLAWAPALLSPSLWRVLDVSSTSGVAAFTVALVNEAAAMADGLRALDVRGRSACELPHAALLSLVCAHATTLRQAAQLVLAAPGLRVLEASVVLEAPALLLDHPAATASTTVAQATAMLLNQPPWRALRLVGLAVVEPSAAAWGGDAGVAAVCAALSSHPSLAASTVALHRAPLASPAALERVAAAAAGLRLRGLLLSHCALAPQGAPRALARLVAAGTLARLWLRNHAASPPLLGGGGGGGGGGGAAALCAALRGCGSLRALGLECVGLFSPPPAAAATGLAVLAALLHPPSAVAQLSLDDNPVGAGAGAAAAVGDAIAALLFRPSHPLRGLRVAGCGLGDAGLAPVFDAMGSGGGGGGGGCGGSRLASLSCGGNALSAACARGRLLPAVRACASLRRLEAQTEGAAALAGAAEAEAVAAARR